MANEPSDRRVRVTGEERPHPALRKLGRACIALARWQREQEQSRAPADPAGTDTPTEPNPQARPANPAPTAERPEVRNA